MTKGMKKKILVAMSGGVDSSAAALILKNSGYDVAGVTMCLKNVQLQNNSAACSASRAVDDARCVCQHLGIRHVVLDFSQHLQKHVINNFVAEYCQGRTPNPCVQCNKYIKFGLLFHKAVELGFDMLSTGHYAATVEHQGRTVLRTAKDIRKDQSYFLYAVNNAMLKHIVFPLADYKKDEIRNLARDAGLPVADKQDSQDICFIPGGNYRKFLLQHTLDIQPGDIVDLSGKKIGVHKGIPFYTIGQRGGLGIAAPEPLYVTAIDAKNNRIIASSNKHVKSRRLRANNLIMHYTSLPDRAMAKIRYAHKPSPCSFSVSGTNMDVVFDELHNAITPGQSVVLYEDDRVIGGGIINEVLHED
jgi:tRNA-uridine 2-sulfurtransferase